jgi:uncharacterized protein (TIGR02466 family)
MSDPMTSPSWEPDFFDFWPVMLIRRRLPDFEGPTRELVALVEKMDRDHDQMTARYQSIDIFSLDHSGIQWLRNGIDETVKAYFDELDMKTPAGWSIRGWANVNRRGDYHAPHNHAWSYLSGTYYAKMPEPEKAPGVPGRASPAAISFYDPRVAVNMLALGDEALSFHEFSVNPESGMLLLWHSSVTHSVHPNLSEDTRVTLSFNLSLAWSDDYVAGE